MTYYNANVYVAEPTKFAHDECLPDSEFDVIMLANYSDEPFINERGFPEYPKEPHRQQKSPWNWSPIYGAPEPCYVCGRPVK
jgi:hypothetical protein